MSAENNPIISQIEAIATTADIISKEKHPFNPSRTESEELELRNWLHHLFREQKRDQESLALEDFEIETKKSGSEFCFIGLSADDCFICIDNLMVQSRMINGYAYVFSWIDPLAFTHRPYPTMLEEAEMMESQVQQMIEYFESPDIAEEYPIFQSSNEEFQLCTDILVDVDSPVEACKREFYKRLGISMTPKQEKNLSDG